MICPPPGDVNHGTGRPWPFNLAPAKVIGEAPAHAALGSAIKISIFFSALRASCWEGDRSWLHMASCQFACSPNP